jgi:hypothetical protein
MVSLFLSVAVFWLAKQTTPITSIPPYKTKRRGTTITTSPSNTKNRTPSKNKTLSVY